jgi:hypothetical protein
MTAIDTKPSRRRFDQAPRLKRQKPTPAPLLDDAEARLLIADEKTYRRHLWDDFARFARSHGGYVVSVPCHSPVRVQVPAEDTSLENAMASLPRYRVIKLGSIGSRLAHGVCQTMRELEIYLWPRA